MAKTHKIICDVQNNAQKSTSVAGETFVGVIDQGISGTRFLVFSSKTQLPVASHELSVTNISCYEGWVEHDPEDVLAEVKDAIAITCEKLIMMDISPSAIAAIGLTNQRDTTLVWDKYTGTPLYNAIIWMDMKSTQSIVDRFINNKIPNCNTLEEQKKYLQYKCGSMINPYFSVFKLIWLIENIPQVSRAIQERRCMFGSMDSWLIWNLTGGINGGAHITDVTNASRTMLMNIYSLKWDNTLTEFFDIPKRLLFPDIRSCSEVYGLMTSGPLINIPISGCIADHQAAFLGQLCLTSGQVKCTFGSNCFLLYNTGRKPVISNHGLLTTVAYKIGKHSDAIYALEGSVTVAEFTTEWLRNNLWIMDIYKSGKAVEDTNNIHIVPPLSELYAPFWITGPDGKCTGVTLETTEAHIMEKTLETICFQTKDVMESMESDTGYPVMALYVDGGMSTNDTFLKVLTNICLLSVVRPKMLETTALGAAFAAGFAVGIWNINNVASDYDTFIHSVSKEEQKSKHVSLENTINPNKGLNNIDEENEHDKDDGF